MGAKDLVDRIPLSVKAKLIGGVFRLPPSVKRAIAGKQVRKDGQYLDLDMQLIARTQQSTGQGALEGPSISELRRGLREASVMVGGKRIEPVATKKITIEHLDARLYTPKGLAEGSPLLVFYHGGGFTLGDLESHDNLCRYLAKQAELRVLAIDYRLAPEHQFPAGVEDCLTAFRYAREHAAELGADPHAIAVGGDSAGGNLSIVVALIEDPEFVLAIYPVTNPSAQTRSRELFAEGFVLTKESIDQFDRNYSSREADRSDFRFAPNLAEDLSGLPPTYLVTAGFDPLRDEGEEFAARAAAAGVPIVLKRQPDLIHGFTSMIGVSPRCVEAVSEMAGALRMALRIQQKP